MGVASVTGGQRSFVGIILQEPWPWLAGLCDLGIQLSPSVALGLQMHVTAQCFHMGSGSRSHVRMRASVVRILLTELSTQPSIVILKHFPRFYYTLH